MPESRTSKDQWSYRDWYKKNRGRLNKQRRDRYRDDFEFREKTKAQARDSYRKRRARLPRPVAGIFVDSKGRAFYTLRIIQEVTGVSAWMLRHYHKEEVIPACKYFTPSGWRLYDENQKSLLAEAFERFRADPNRKSKIRMYLQGRW